MLSKMCIIFTVATAALLVGSHSAAAAIPMGDMDDGGTMPDMPGKGAPMGGGGTMPDMPMGGGGTMPDMPGTGIGGGGVPPMPGTGIGGGGAPAMPGKGAPMGGGGTNVTPAPAPAPAPAPCQACSNGGTITGTTGNCGCSCAKGYSGNNCETVGTCKESNLGYNGKACSNGGTITGTLDTRPFYAVTNLCRCSCAKGYSGDNCETDHWKTGNCGCKIDPSRFGYLKAGDEEEAKASVAAAAATTNNQPTSDAEVARTVFEGIIAIAFLYVAYVVGAKSRSDSGIIANPVDGNIEISEI